MEEIYVNVEYKHDNPIPSAGHTGPRNSKKIFHSGVILSLGLLSVFLLIGLIIFGVYYRDSVRDSAANLLAMSNKLSSMTEERDLLNANLSTMSDKLSSLSEERDLLHLNLTEKNKELERLSKKKKTCPAGWSRFSCSCYLLSESSASWDEGRKDCRDRGADLVVIDSPEEQKFLTNYTQIRFWIGLNDKEVEGTWKWIDGTPLTLKYWGKSEPNNIGEEDCAEFYMAASWNDLSCSSTRQWVCEKMS